MSKYNLTYKPFGKSAILIEWPSKIDEAIIRDVVAFENTLEKERQILDTLIAYHSLTIRYDAEVDFEAEVSHLKKWYGESRQQKEQEGRLWHIPVCYDLEFGLDLEEIAQTKNISIEDVIQLHSSPDYLVYFLGFRPGFLYLGGLHSEIHIPRRANPRLRVAKGSVGIGGEQTGVYPQESAGGWNILGKSPIDFFDPSSSNPCFARAGDRVKFEPVDRDTFHELEAKVQGGNYKLKFQEP